MDNVIKRFKTYCLWPWNEDTCCQPNLDMQVANIIMIIVVVFFNLYFIKYYIDGQSIASRLAKKITSATTTLKRAISRYNNMRLDTLEGNAYSLPRRLQFDSVKNLEELSSLELLSLVSKPASDVPITLWVRVVRETNLINRATEEENIISKEFVSVEKSMKEEHSTLQKHLSSMSSESHSTCFQKGCIHYLKRKLLRCEASLLSFSKTVSMYHTINLPHLQLVHSDYQSCDYISQSDFMPNVLVSDSDNSDSDSDEENLS